MSSAELLGLSVVLGLDQRQRRQLRKGESGGDVGNAGRDTDIDAADAKAPPQPRRKEREGER